jgi:heptosyltransferase-2
VKILVIRFSSIGDIVLTTPVLRALKKQLGAEVHFLTKKQFAAILAPNPYLSKVLEFDQNLRQLRTAIRAEQYDRIIDLHHNLRSWLITWGMFTPTKRFDKLNWRKWWLVRWKKNFLPKVHIVDRYLATVKELGIKADGKGLDFFISPEDQEVSGLPKTPYLALVVGAAHATKRIPMLILKKIVLLSPISVVVLGGKEDTATGLELAKWMPEKVVNFCGKLTLGQSAFALQSAQKVITPDTGLMHIAAAFDREIISIWGSTVPAFGMTPYQTSKSSVVEVENLDCRPCSKIGFSDCPKGHFKCMRGLDLQRIGQLINQS